MNILVADHHALMREGLALFLDDLYGTGAAVTGVASLADLFAMLGRTSADMVLLDPDMPGSTGASIIADIRRHRPGIIAVVVSARSDDRTIAEALRHGARAFVPKASGFVALREALEVVMAGGIFTPPGFASCAVNTMQPPTPGRATQSPASRHPGLTRRQSEVLDCIRRGLSNREIAIELGMSEGTVKNHVKALMKVLNVRNRTQAALLVLAPANRQAALVGTAAE